MATIEAGQLWSYRAPHGFEHSRLVVGAIVKFEQSDNIVCCSVVGVPKSINGSGATATISFLPLTEKAFRASVSALDGTGELPGSFARKFVQWAENPTGLVAFNVPFAGSVDEMIELQFGRRADLPERTGVEIHLDQIRELLAGGLKTEVEPFPQTQTEFEEILARLRKVGKEDVLQKLVIAGFVDHPFGPDQQRCLECIYYLPHRLWCDLPELDLPVEPYWWCRMWRV